MGLVRPRGRGPGESDLRRACVIGRILYFQVVTSGFRGKGREDLTFRSYGGGVGRGSRGRWSRLGLVEWEGAGINTFWRLRATIHCSLCLATYLRLVAAYLATAGCAAMCARASYGPGDGLSSCASPGVWKRAIGQLDQLRECILLPDFGFVAN